MKKGDYILIFILIIPALIFLLIFNYRNAGSEVIVYVGGEEIGRYELNENRDIIIQGLNNISDTLTIAEGKAYMSNASCPDRICMKSGSVHCDNESICCAPGGILVVVNSSGKAEYDAITR